MADQVFNSEEQQNLLVQFADIESSAKPEFNSANAVQKIEYLASVYL